MNDCGIVRKVLILTLACLLLFPVTAKCDYGSVYYERVIRFHPFMFFFHYPELKIYVSPEILEKRIGGYDPDNLYLIQFKLKQKLMDDHSTLIEKKWGLRTEREFLEERLKFLFEQYTSSAAGKADPESDRRYLEEKKEIQEQINKIRKQENSMDSALSDMYIADPEEEDKLIRTVRSDIKDAVSAVKESRHLDGIVFVPGPFKATGEVKTRGDLRLICALDARPSQAQAENVKRHLLRFSKAPSSFNDFFLYGGRDITGDVLKQLFEKYRVSADLQNKIFHVIEGGEE